MLYRKSLKLVLAYTFALYLSPAIAETTTVDVIYPESSVNEQSLLLIGTVEAQQHAQLAPLQSGVIAAIFVEEGDEVEKGQKLMALDARLAELSLAEAKASVKAAKASQKEAQRLYEEITDLSTRQLVAETLLAERKSALTIANANLNQSLAKQGQQQELLTRHTLFAPFDGIVSQRNIDIGEWVTQQTATFTLVENARLRLRISIPQEYAHQLSTNVNTKVTVTADSLGAEPWTGNLSRLVNVATGNSRTLTGLVNLPARSDWVVGGSARAEIALPVEHEVMVWLPKTAIKRHPDGGTSIFAVVNNKAQRHFVKTVRTSGDTVAVTGAPTGLPLVSNGVALLQQGQALQVGKVSGNRR